MYIETKRLLLRTIQPNDVDALINLWTDPDITRFMGGPREEFSLRRNLHEDVRNPTQYQFNLWPVIEKETEKLIGHCGLLEKEIDGKNEIELVYVIAKSAWNKGFAGEIAQALANYAREKMAINRLVSLIDPMNIPSQRLAEKLGMHLQKEILRPDGKIKKLFVKELSS